MEYSINFLLNRAYDQASSKTKIKLTQPTFQILNKKTCITNFETVCNELKRSIEQVQTFIDSELQTSSIIDGNNNIVINGTYKENGIKNVLKNYINKYVFCNQCKNLDTEIIKENKIQYLKCNTCFSKKSIMK
ncbi:translation initiation factor 2 subunit beta [Hokovirus HKV1]|uniref:Translation initiation factor 2 subunit beta n=1 Tax=Hokovirus HKV1 TaxID=1977638 RepID=A0A1V0SHJ2_9VIRU|nr:translation initiation factor 2 subunit beta [Hokovirus HKV1]